jgi:rod shape-determining protein MreD
MVLVLVLQSTIVRMLEIGSVVPDLTLIFIVVVSLRFGSIAGLWFGFMTGLVQDVYQADHLGAYALSKTLLGYAVGLAEEHVLRLYWVSKVLLLAFAFLLHDLVHATAMGLDQRLIPDLLIHRTLPEGLYTVVIGSLWFYFTSARSGNVD